LGKDGKKYADIAEAILPAIKETMIIDGPLGQMLSGGTNLDVESEGIFINDNSIPYYDGEDTGTMLAPVYGACADDYPPWVNYQRFGRSLFCENYQAETDARAWYAAAPLSLDGTAILASLSGAVSREEMIDTAKTVLNYVDPVTGSLFWWPSGPLECRKLTRCSQGQGAWAWQYRSRWLGIESDGVTKTLSLIPKGLPSKVHIHPAINAAFPFEIEFDETEGTCVLQNFSDAGWTVNAGFRTKGSGADGELKILSQTVKAGEKIKLSQKEIPGKNSGGFSKKDIYSAEIKAFGKDGIMFFRQGGLWFWLQHNTPPFDLRFVIGNGMDEDWQDSKVRLLLPKGCSASTREPGTWRFGKEGVKHLSEAVCHVGAIKQGERKTASFVFSMPFVYKTGGKNDDINRHLLEKPLTSDAIIASSCIAKEETVEVTASLEIISASGKQITRLLNFRAGYKPRVD
jgi:hypothetical protein